MRTLAGWCVLHRRIVLAIWAVVLIISLALGSGVGSSYSSSFSLPNTESANAIKLLQSVSPRQSGDTEQIVFTTSGGQLVTDPAVWAQVETMIAKVQKLPHVTTIISPYTPQGAHDVNAAKNTAFFEVNVQQQFNALNQTEAKKFVNTAITANGHGVKVAVSGNLAQLSNRQSIGGVGFGVILALIVLLLVFGSVFAALLPLISALFALGTALGLVELLSHLV